MNTKDPKLIALQFNEYINKQDIEALSSLMSEDHTFIDREGHVVRPKKNMVEAWIEFFQMLPDYENTFVRVESRDDLVIVLGYAYWNEENKYDPVIWTAKIENDLVAEWRIYADTKENRTLLGIV